MRWPGRASRVPRPDAVVPTGPGPSPEAVAPERPALLGVRDPEAERLRRGVVSQVMDEQQRELDRLSGTIDRISTSTTTTGSLVEGLAADLGREFDRLRAASEAWAQGTATTGATADRRPLDEPSLADGAESGAGRPSA